MITVADIRADIRARGFEADTDVQQLAFINSAQRRAAGEYRAEWTKASTTAAVVAGTGDVTLPAAPAGGRVISIRLQLAAGPAGIAWMDPETLLENRAQDNGALGTSTHWALTAPTTISLWPTPSAAGTLTIRYHRVPPTLTVDADTPIIPLGFRDILSVGACMLMARRERQRQDTADFEEEFLARCTDLRRSEAAPQQQTPYTVGESGFYPHG